MKAMRVLACLGFIVALGYFGVSWAVAGVGLCVFATIALVLICRSPETMGHRPDSGERTAARSTLHPDSTVR
jgi:hypothetical protein